MYVSRISLSSPSVIRDSRSFSSVILLGFYLTSFPFFFLSVSVMMLFSNFHLAALAAGFFLFSSVFARNISEVSLTECGVSPPSVGSNYGASYVLIK